MQSKWIIAALFAPLALLTAYLLLTGDENDDESHEVNEDLGPQKARSANHSRPPVVPDKQNLRKPDSDGRALAHVKLPDIRPAVDFDFTEEITLWKMKHKGFVESHCAPSPSGRLAFANFLADCLASVASDNDMVDTVAEHYFVNCCVMSRALYTNAIILKLHSHDKLLRAVREKPTVGAGCTGVQRILAHLCLPDYDKSAEALGPLHSWGRVLDSANKKMAEAGIPIKIRHDFDEQQFAVHPDSVVRVVHGTLDAKLNSANCVLYTIFIQAKVTLEHYVVNLIQIPPTEECPIPRYLPLQASIQHYSLGDWIAGRGNAASSPYAGGR